MLVSPFSVLKELRAPDGAGIYVTPWDAANPKGWGEPRRTPEGEPILPGTPGGPLPSNLITPEHLVINSTAFQRSGNISWLGPYYDPAHPSKGSYVLSYHGPRARNFLDHTFRYGDSPKHNEIYRSGGLLTIAPGPVLGACLRLLPVTNYQTGVTTQVLFVIAACMSGNNTIFYKRKAGAVTRKVVIPDDFIEGQKALYHETKAPAGWQVMGTVSGPSGGQPSETPWFFNESGTEAMCMRRKLLTFNNNGATVTEPVYTRYVATVQQDVVTGASVANHPPMKYKETYVRNRNYFSYEAREPYITRNNQEDWLELEITLNGKQEVMCDYVGDERVVGLINCTVRRSLQQYSSINNGPETTLHVPPGPYSPIPTQYPIPYNLDPVPPYIPSPKSHYETLWVADDAQFMLEVSVGNVKTLLVEMYGAQSGSSDEYAGLPRQEWNVYLYFIRRSRRQICGLCDTRFNILHALNYTNEAISARTGPDFSNLLNTSVLYAPGYSSGKKLQTHTSTGTPSNLYGWPRETLAELTPLDFVQVVARDTYNASWPDDNATGAVRQPGSRTGFGGEAAVPWPTIDEIIAGISLGEVTGNGVVADGGAYALCLEIPDVANPGQYVVVSDSSHGKLSTLVGHGTRFYPMGTG